MKEYYTYHSFEILTDRCYLLPAVPIHFHEQGEDYSRRGLQEKFLFDGITISFLIFELRIGVKIYENLTF